MTDTTAASAVRQDRLATSRINVACLALAGCVAATVHFVVTGLVNGVVLGGALQSWVSASGAFVHPTPLGASIGLWALMSLTYGLVGIWLYAVLGTRFGAGIKAALLSGLALWLVSKFAVALDFISLGAVPIGLVAGQAAGGLVAILAAMLVGSRFYRE